MPAAGFAYAFLQLSRSAITLYLPSSPVIAYSERFTIAHLPTKKRSLSRKEKAIAHSLQKSVRIQWAFHHRSSPYKRDRPFPTKKRSLSRQEKAIAFVPSKRSTNALNLPSSPAIALQQ